MVYEVAVTDRDGDPVKVTARGDGTYTFTQPSGKVTIEVTFCEKKAPGLPFTDLEPGAWYYDAVHWAYRTGLVSGTSPTTFTPDAAITRQDFTVILYAQAGRPAMTGTALAAFPDAGQVAGYAYAALTWAVEQGLIGGVGTPSGPQLAPRGYATRAQVAKILMGYYDK